MDPFAENGSCDVVRSIIRVTVVLVDMYRNAIKKMRRNVYIPSVYDVLK